MKAWTVIFLGGLISIWGFTCDLESHSTSVFEEGSQLQAPGIATPPATIVQGPAATQVPSKSAAPEDLADPLTVSGNGRGVVSRTARVGSPGETKWDSTEFLEPRSNEIFTE